MTTRKRTLPPQPKISSIETDSEILGRGDRRLLPVSADRNLPFPTAMLPLSQLSPSPRNARTHSKKQIRLIADSIMHFGFTTPVLIDENYLIIAGHARVEAAKLLGMRDVPTIRLSHLNDTQIRAYMLADNKLAERAGWDHEILAVELDELRIALPEIKMDLDITGFDPGEVDSIILDAKAEQVSALDEIPDSNRSAVSREGEIFVLGSHRLVVGDARDNETFVTLLQSEKVEMAFLDPPYNVRIKGHAGGRGRIKHREFAEASGEMNSDQYAKFLEETLGNCARHTVDGGISYVCMDWRHAGELLKAGKNVYDGLKNICVWTKTSPGQGSFYRNQHEFVFVYKKGEAAHINTFELGQNGRSRSNVWTYPGANTFRAGRLDELKMHPTVKPVSLVTDTMRDCSRRGSAILDAFAGSGTTIVAAEQIGRRAFCIEIDPIYVDVAIKRWQRITGKDAILETTGETFDEIERLRTTAHLPASKRGKDLFSRGNIR